MACLVVLIQNTADGMAHFSRFPRLEDFDLKCA
jgi:hypothetical protein